MNEQVLRIIQVGDVKPKRFMTILTGLWLIGLLIDSTLWAQANPERLNAIKAALKQVKAFSQKLPEGRRKALSGAAQNLIHLAEGFDELESILRRASPQLSRQAKSPSNLKAAERGQGASGTPVSDPSTDLVFSPLDGFHQNETSTAWCGSNVVVGFNDSGSFLETVLSETGGWSFVGVARSTDQGKSFEDLGILNPGDPRNFLAGDPVVGCADANSFYFTSLLTRFSFDPDAFPETAVSVSKSLDGGLTWGDPVPAVSKDGSSHFLDKPWMTVDPTNPQRIFVTYTDFDFSSGAVVELVRSTDGGATWSAPVVLDVGDGVTQGAQVAVGPTGEVYVAWLSSDLFNFMTPELRIRKSTDHGTSFAPIVKVSDVTAVGSGDRLLQGRFRELELPSLAVDRSGTATNGNVYLTWHDGRNFPEEAASFVIPYHYADVLISRSSDGGATWSSPIRVNTNAEPLPSGLGTDQYMPGVAVDQTGKVAVCWYDRRHDPSNFLVERFCGVSTDAGTTWTDKRQSAPGWEPHPFFEYMGDYDTVASDFTQSGTGFIGAFQFIRQDNPDVVATRFH